MSAGPAGRRRKPPPRSADLRAARLVDLLLRLHRGGTATAPELAEDMKVAVRTIYRDLSDLQVAGFPIWTGTGPGAGARLVDGWLSRMEGLTPDEATAVMLRATPVTAGQLGLATAAVSARSRGKGAPPDVKERAEALAERCLLDAPGWFQRPDDVPHLAALSCAVWDGYRVEVGYGRGDSEVTHLVDPLGLVLRSGRWYAVAAVDGVPRSYRVNRITRVAPGDVPVRRPDGFVLSEWWTDSPAQLDGAVSPPGLTLRLSTRALGRLHEVVEPVMAQHAIDGASPPDDEGWFTVTLASDGTEVAPERLLALGDGVEVVAPPALRATVATLAQALLARHT
ncbi:MAG TPA: WYL domain-containing protein [Acidimicrobiales bacterium]|nr:WYL domain-containing protein [Acidimicrobiales bacterium]